MIVVLFTAFVLIAAACGEGEQSADDENTTTAPSSSSTDDDGGAGDGAEATDDGGGAGDGGEATDDSGTSEGEDSEDAAPPPAEELDCSQAEAGDVGVTADTITVGLISVDLEPLFGTGFVNENTVKNFYSRNMSLLHAVNQSGGINCRQIVLVQETYDPSHGVVRHANAHA